MPVYKVEEYVGKAIESIQAQTLTEWEFIIVDDGTPDKSGEICDAYAEKDNRIKVIHKENGGACEARNYGINAATGEYITIIDGDDWLEPDYIEYLLKIALDNQADMSMTDRIFTTRDFVQTQNDNIEVWSSEKAAAYILYPRIPIGPWNKLYKLEYTKKNMI